MIKYILHRPVAVLMSMIAFVALGIAASLRLPVSLMPDIDIPEITVHYTLDDASVREVEHTITTPLRGQLQQIPRLTELHTESKEGNGTISMRFEYGTSIDYAFIEVNQKVDAAMNNLPRELTRPSIIKASTSDLPVFYVNLALEGAVTEERFLEFCEFTGAVLKKRLEQLPDVAMVDVSGGYSPELYILPDESKMRALQLSQEELRAAINNNNQISGSLAVKDGYYQYGIKFSSQLMSPGELEEVYLNVNGRLLQVKEIAKVGARPRDKRGLFLHDDRQALSLAIIKQSSARVSAMKENVSKLLDEFRREYAGIEFVVSRDQARLLNYSIDNLSNSLAQGIFLAIFAMIFFLCDARSPLIIAISIPVSVVISVLFFYLLGLSINTISLSGLILGVGMMVDNTIIVIDNIHQHRRRGASLFDACVRGTGEVITPLLSSVLTTCAVFVPLVFLSGIAGALFYDQALAVSISLFVSLGVSVLVVPVVFHLLFARAEEIRLDRFVQKISIKKLDEYYTTIFHVVFHHRRAILLGCLLTLLVGVGVFRYLRLERMPRVTTNEMIVAVDWNSPLHVDENRRRAEEIMAIVRPACEEVSCRVGEKLFLLGSEGRQEINEMEIYLRAAGTGALREAIDAIRDLVNARYPEARVDVRETENLFEQLFKSDDVPLIAYLSGDSRREILPFDTVAAFIDRLNARMPSLRLDKPATAERVVIELLPDRLALYKVDQGNLIRALEKNISKTSIGKLNTGNRYIPIVIAGEERTIWEILQSTSVTNASRVEIPVTALTRLNKELDYKVISGRKEGIVVPVNVYRAGDTVQQIVRTIREEGNARGMNTLFGGAYFAGEETAWEMLMVVFVAILMLYFILAAQFESLTLPLILLVEIPLDVAFTFILLWVTGVSLNLMSMIGIVVMCGVVINDSILKIDTIRRLQRDGLPLLDAIHEGGVRRLKPILMTSLTTILALVPLLWGDDIGSQLQRPMAVTL
ncbi:MAG: efflux RND transporter permease subunit, partial [Odoribacteraceae bacterium]|nr:efflux RND transporter permease subunit [Odoribacteraceae bacterium]